MAVTQPFTPLSINFYIFKSKTWKEHSCSTAPNISGLFLLVCSAPLSVDLRGGPDQRADSGDNRWVILPHRVFLTHQHHLILMNLFFFNNRKYQVKSEICHYGSNPLQKKEREANRSFLWNAKDSDFTLEHVAKRNTSIFPYYTNFQIYFFLSRLHWSRWHT